jgi:methionine-rich copper-binding protein CopC
MRPRTRVRRRYAVVALAMGLAPALAWGHAALVRSTPAQRVTLARSPDRVRLWFNEPLEAKFARVSVWDAEGRQVDQQDVLVGPEDPKALSVGISALGPGRYTIRYRVLSVDGHVVEGSFRFTVRASP